MAEIDDLKRQIDIVKAENASLTQRCTSIEHQMNSHDQRVQAIEAWRSDQRVDNATRAERDIHMDARFDRMEKQIAEIKGYLIKIVWIIVAGILGSLVTFIVRGGLSIGS
jgi:predicted nuclease with TOPRIM domain